MKTVSTVDSDDYILGQEEMINKPDIFKITNYKNRKLQVSIGLEEDATTGVMLFKIREGENSEVVYDSATAEWDDREMNMFKMLMSEVDAPSLEHLRAVPKFSVYLPRMEDQKVIAQSIKLYNQDIAQW